MRMWDEGRVRNGGGDEAHGYPHTPALVPARSSTLSKVPGTALVPARCSTIREASTGYCREKNAGWVPGTGCRGSGVPSRARDGTAPAA
eukprot:955299-Rhodomonas_salina.1